MSGKCSWFVHNYAHTKYKVCLPYLVLASIWTTVSPPTADANLMRLCLPDPPTPIRSNDAPCMMNIRHMRATYSSANLNVKMMMMSA